MPHGGSQDVRPGGPSGGCSNNTQYCTVVAYSSQGGGGRLTYCSPATKRIRVFTCTNATEKSITIITNDIFVCFE